jgi:hypothetical protein
MVDPVVVRVTYKRENFFHFPWALEARHIEQLGDLLRSYLGEGRSNYQVQCNDGSIVHFSDRTECVKYLSNMPAPKRLENLAIFGDDGGAKSVKVYLNRFLLGAILAGELHVQFGTASYYVSSASNDDVIAKRDQIEGILNDLRQSGRVGVLAKASMHPVWWIVFALVASFLLFVLSGSAELEVAPEGTLTYWLRNHSQQFYIMLTIVSAVLVFLPYALRSVYPYTIVRIGAEGRRIARLETLRMVIFRYIVLAFVVGIACIYAYEHWNK